MFHITKVSSNSKVGPIPVTTSSAKTCPSTCPFVKGCYAKSGPLAIHWKKVTKGERGVSTIRELVAEIETFPKNQLWRHNQAGDLPGEDTHINIGELKAIVDANKGKKGFTYTHKPVTNHPEAERNREAIKFANDNGFTINLSANNLEHADELKALDIGPVCVVIPDNLNKSFITKAGNKVITCPSQLNDKVSCSTCKLCQRKDRNFMIGFIAHGTAKNKVLAEGKASHGEV